MSTVGPENRIECREQETLRIKVLDLPPIGICLSSPALAIARAGTSCEQEHER